MRPRCTEPGRIARARDVSWIVGQTVALIAGPLKYWQRDKEATFCGVRTVKDTQHLRPDAPAGVDETEQSCAARPAHTRSFRQFVAGLAGYDLNLLYKYAGPEAEHERNRLVRIGASVVIPAVLSFFTALLFLRPYVGSPMTRALAAMTTALVVLIIDCIIVTTFSRNGGFVTIVRVAISLCMGVVFAEPLLLACIKIRSTPISWPPWTLKRPQSGGHMRTH